jgi:hypothetical protein
MNTPSTQKTPGPDALAEQHAAAACRTYSGKARPEVRFRRRAQRPPPIKSKSRRLWESRLWPHSLDSAQDMAINVISNSQLRILQGNHSLRDYRRGVSLALDLWLLQF